MVFYCVLSVAEGDQLCVVMELIEGAPLAEHFSSLKEKGQKFTEERIWNIFIQVDLFNCSCIRCKQALSCNFIT